MDHIARAAREINFVPEYITILCEAKRVLVRDRCVTSLNQFGAATPVFYENGTRPYSYFRKPRNGLQGMHARGPASKG